VIIDRLSCVELRKVEQYAIYTIMKLQATMLRFSWSYRKSEDTMVRGSG